MARTHRATGRYGCTPSLIAISEAEKLPRRVTRAATRRAKDAGVEKESQHCPLTIVPSHKPKKVKASPKNTLRQVERDVKLQKAEAAAKLLVKRNHPVARKQPFVGPLFVYVGNLQPGMSPGRLTRIFSVCGTVTRVEMRCSSGQLPVVGLQIPTGARHPRNRLYATVEFADRVAGRRALTLDGASVDGQRLVVTTIALKLPDGEELSQQRRRENAKVAKQQDDSASQPLISKVKSYVRNALKPKPLQPADTVPVPEELEPPKFTPGRIKFLGYSFALNIV